jgi:chaperone modulatory protein CbpM
MMNEENVLKGVVVDETCSINLHEICESYHVHIESVVAMVEHGLLEPEGEEPQEWNFALRDVHRLQKTLHLQQDLEINLEGVALILDLMDELEELRSKVRRLEQMNSAIKAAE